MCPIKWFRSSVNKQISETLNEILSLVDQSQQTSGVEKVKMFVTERLAAAAEEISVVFERAIWEYQQEIERQRRLLDIVLKRDMKSHREDAQHLIVCKEEKSPSMDQEEPAPPHIKEEQEERETLPGLKEADIIKFTFNPENDEEKQPSHPYQQRELRICKVREHSAFAQIGVIAYLNDEEKQPSHPYKSKENGEPEPLAGTSADQMKTESDEEDWGLSEADSNLDPAGSFEPTNECQPLSSDCSESESEYGEDEWRETRKPGPGLKKAESEKLQRAKQQNVTVGSNFSPSKDLSNELISTSQSQPSFGCKVCGMFYPTKKSLMSHIKCHSRDCGLCGKHLELGESLKLHFEVHKTCDFCSKKCATICDLEKHLLVHTKQKPFSCAICKKEFTGKCTLKIHMRLHTGEKPYTCAVCNKSFTQTGSLKIHMRYHTGERPFSCTVCKKDFIDKTHLNTHMRQHTGEKPYSCAFCIKSYRRNSDLKSHMKIHMVGTSDGHTNVPFYYGPLIRPGNVTANLMLQNPYSQSNLKL